MRDTGDIAAVRFTRLTGGGRGLALSLLTLFAILWCAPALAQRAESAGLERHWAHEISDIAPDPAVTYGALPNGMRYALLRNELPPGAVSIRFAFEFGSLYESENEQGLAHFIEHMAFNGSTNVPEGEMVKILERLGLAFGADTNASTGQYHTVYSLELPNASDALLDESLLLMRETASELLFTPEAIERERGVVLAEFRRSDNFSRRRSQQQLDFLIPGSMAAARLPIGQPGVIETAQRETFVSLYNRYYRPERAVLVIAGDIDVAAVEAKIAERFNSWQGRGTAGAEPEEGYDLSERGPAASVFVHPDGGDSISVHVLSPYAERPDTAAVRRENNLLSFANAALSRRLSVLTNSADPPFRRASLSRSDILRAVDAVNATVSVTPGEWAKGLRAVEQEWRRALEHGFTQDEIDQQIASMRTSVANAAQRENTRTTAMLAGQLLDSILEDSVFSTPSSGLARFESWAGEATPEVIHAIFRERMTMGDPLFFLAATEEQPGAEEAIPEVWRESKETAVAAPAEIERKPFAYTDFGAAGEITSDRRIEDIDTRLLTFANGVMLNLRKTDFQKNVVQVSVRISGGNVALEEAPYGLASLMRAYSDGGLAAHSRDELRAILSGRAVQVGLSASSTAFGGVYSTTPADLELQMQVAAAFLVAPGYRIEAERQWRESVMLAWPRMDANAQSVMNNEGMRILASGDKRFGSHPDDGVVNRSFTELQGHVGPMLAQNAIEIAIVGDFDEAAAISAVAKTFGALARRDVTPPPHRSRHPAEFRAERSPLVLHHDGEPTQALVNVYWPVKIDPDANPQADRVLAVLAAVMRLKMIDIVRERLGASYSPGAAAYASMVYPEWGYVVASSEVRPEDADAVAAAFREIAGELRDGKISEDEFQRAVTPSLEQLPRNKVSNGYWLSLISQAQTRPELVERGRLDAIEESLRAVTIADVTAAAQRWMTDSAEQRVTVLPGADD
jgi:zinc protease